MAANGNLKQFILAPARKASSKPSGREQAQNVRTLPESTIGHKLPPQLERFLEIHPPKQTKIAWPIPSVLGFGAPPSEKPDATEFLKMYNIRILIDMTEQLDPNGFYAKSVQSASTMLIRLEANSRVKLNVTQFAAKCRIIRQSLAYIKQASDLGESQPMTMYVCDSRGGGTAALLVILLVAQQMSCSIEDAAVFVTRCWAEHANHLGSTVPRMFPQSSDFKTDIFKIYDILRQRTIGGCRDDDEAIELFDTHNVKFTAMAALKLLELDRSLIIGAVPFEKANLFSVVTWLKKGQQSKRGFNRLVNYSDDDDDDDDDDRYPHQKRTARE